MGGKAMRSLIEIFTLFPDPRKGQGKQHLLRDILVVSVCGIICGYSNFVDIADFCKRNEKFFRDILRMEDNEKMPAHDVFSRVFRIIDAKYFMEVFIEWMNGILPNKADGIIAIDGKAIKSAIDNVNNGNVPYIVSAFLTDIGLALGEIRVNEKSNEIKAIPELLKILEIEGAIVTIDAIGTQEKIIKKIAKKKPIMC